MAAGTTLLTRLCIAREPLVEIVSLNCGEMPLVGSLSCAQSVGSLLKRASRPCSSTAWPEEPPEKDDLFFHRLRGLTVRVGPHGTGRARADASPGRVSALHTGTLGPATGRQGSGHARYALRSVSQPVGLGGRKRADTDFELAFVAKKNLSTGSFSAR